MRVRFTSLETAALLWHSLDRAVLWNVSRSAGMCWKKWGANCR